MRLRLFIGLTLLLGQVVMIFVARFHPMRYYSWAPYDSQNEYVIVVKVRGRELPSKQIKKRYRIPARGRNPRSIYQTKDIIAHVERVYYKNDRAKVTLSFRTNGKTVQVWRWPEQ